MAKQRVDRLNSLLREVISEVIKRDVKHHDVHELTTVTRVEISKDLRHAKVFVSVIGTKLDRMKTVDALEEAKGFIAVNSAKKVVMRYFPDLRFVEDDSVDKQMRIEELIKGINDERSDREETEDSVENG